MGLFRRTTPHRPTRPAWGPRLSDALHETGSYRVTYDGWTPASLPGDPVLDWTSTIPRREAIRVSDSLIAIAPARAEVAALMLERAGLAPRRDAEDWTGIERHLIALAEPSKEPRDASLPYPVMRPAYCAFLLDVALLFAERAMLHRPALRLMRADAERAWNARWLRQAPRIIDHRGEFYLYPVEVLFDLGARAVLGDTRERNLACHLDAELCDDLDEDDEVRLFWDGFVKQHGRFPTYEELAEFIVTNEYRAKDIPVDLYRLLRDT